MANRLARSQSPYLRQHAENPVDWWEWSPEALAEAERRDLPILLSVGYAACHWCHVMAHESFEDAATAAYMNEHFVNIKVDREERPDIDAVYMRATQAMTGQGGWPMTCILTPTGEPFFAGTYFPPEPRGGHPAFSQVLQALADAWENRREEVLSSAGQVLDFLSEADDFGGEPLSAEDLDRAAVTLVKQGDPEAGGFGDAPKFPPSMVLEFLLRQHARTGDEEVWSIVCRTFEAMARGGMYDQLSGGFARYSVDRFWRVPHFEKMLYDNALLLRAYLHWARALRAHEGSEEQLALAERICHETADFMLTELRTEQGGFASALDADSDGHEGTYYVWNPHQLMKALGTSDAAWAVQLLSVTGGGTFERGFSTLQLLQDPDDPQRWERVRARLLEVRAERTRPARDDKVVAAWNGYAVTALAECGTLLDRPDLIDAAAEAATLLWDLHVEPGFVRTSLGGVRSEHAAVLEDHGAVIEAFIAVLGATDDPRWLDRARRVADRALAHFRAEDGGWYDTADDTEALVVRPRDVSDNANPSGSSALAHGLLALAAVTGDHDVRAAAVDCVESAAALATGAPRFAGWTLAAAEALHDGPAEIAVVGEVAGPMHRAALGLTAPGAVVVATREGSPVPLFEGRQAIGGHATAYVCRDFVCALPVTDPADLAAGNQVRTGTRGD
ncbi:thioredoxin domain-containing protein [Aeromicrobium duanguangcaii]|uniref:thioredoxin domain-containing protein n=1 Tax=Aeromicrobium duanguangcaii TaxID=2968086 RepID=UPI0020182407|nr:thioredoxin domain-containing protein [Aeromicrobium duanguangcaii]MCL3836275.1 thioredoxin domain-containing protein [Aeromicrobium duanguangcaii]